MKINPLINLTGDKYKFMYQKHILKKNLKIAVNKLEKENSELLKRFDKLDNRTNAFLSIILGTFSLQITLLTTTIINLYEKYIVEQNIRFNITYIIHNKFNIQYN